MEESEESFVLCGRRIGEESTYSCLPVIHLVVLCRLRVIDWDAL